MTGVQPLPDVRVELDGRPLDPADLRTLAAVLVRQVLSAPTLAELRFVDPAGPLASAAPVGSAVRVAVGGAVLFDGELTAVEADLKADGGREVRLRGYDKLHRLRRRQPARPHEGRAVADLAADLVADLGVRVEAGERGPVPPLRLQAGPTDFDLLADATARCGLHFTLRGDVLHLLTLAGDGLPFPLRAGDTLHEATFEWNTDGGCRAVAAGGWDWSRAELVKGQARGSAGDGDRTLFNLPVADAAAADAHAQAELDARGARQATVRGTAAGDPRLRPGAVVELRRTPATPPAAYALAAVTHRLDARRGYVSEFDSTPPPPRIRPAGVEMTVGLVSRTDDPERLGRVRAVLPALGGLETGWMPVLSAAAGPGKGLLMSPDAADRVLVLFPAGELAAGVVAGGLYGTGGPPDAAGETAEGRRYTLVTAGGQRVRLDDGRRSVTLEDAAGSVIELAPGGLTVRAVGDLELSAPGKRVRIRGAAIDFEEG